ncbi:MAG: acetyl-CoA carboxylase biotin carboxyl carrier protein [Saprospiraceae bacterium]
MKFEEIQKLLEFISDSNLTEFKVKDGEFELSVRTKEYAKTKAVKSIELSHAPVVAAPQAAPAAPAAESVPAASVPDMPAAPPAAEAPTDSDSQLVAIKSPIVGTFYRSPSPEKPVYAKVGDTVAVGDVVCIVEAMKLFNEIESEVSGKIVKVEVEDASPVEYDTILFWVDPNG